MDYSILPYIINDNYDRVVLITANRNVLADEFLLAYSFLNGVDGIDSVWIRANIMQTIIGQGFSPAPFLVLALKYYAAARNIDDLPAEDDTSKLTVTLTPAADTIKLTVTADDPVLNTLQSEQLEYLLGLTEQFMTFFTFQALYNGQPITDKDGVEVMQNLTPLSVNGALNLLGLSLRSLPNFKARLQQYIMPKVDDARELTFTTMTAQMLFYSGVDQGTWYPVIDGKAFDKYIISRLAGGAITTTNRLKISILMQWVVDNNYDLALTRATALTTDDYEFTGSIAGFTQLAGNKTPYIWITNAAIQAIIGEYIPPPASGIGGRGRADNPDENYYIWSGNVLLAVLFGLSFDKLALRKFPPPGYWETNTPRDRYALLFPPDPRVYLRNPTIDSDVGELIDKLRIKYAKKQNDEVKRKNLPATYAKPREFGLKKNFKYLDSHFINKLSDKFMKDTNEGTSKDGVPLNHKESSERDNAGTVMGKFLLNKKFTKEVDDTQTVRKIMEEYYPINYGKDFAGNTLSATDLTNMVVQYDSFAINVLDKFRSDIPYIKKSKPFHNSPEPVSSVVTLQEWCHLWGHGDGGPDLPKNFSAGSKQCNTEQLAIETGQRKRKLPDLKAKISVYMLPSKSIFYDPNEPAYTGDQGGEAMDIKAEELAQYHLPVAHTMRYRIYAKGKKVVDHWYDGQSQSFDYNEFLILEEWVDWKTSCISELGIIEYRASLISRIITKLIRTYKKEVPKQSGVTYELDKVAYAPFIQYTKDYATAKKRKKSTPNAIQQFVAGTGKGVYDQFGFNDTTLFIDPSKAPKAIHTLLLHLFRQQRTGTINTPS